MSSQHPSLINQIEEIIRTIPGWTPVDQLFSLYMLTRNSKHLTGEVIEIGSWCGRSAAIIGKAIHDSNSNSKLHCIDLFPKRDDWWQNEDGTYSFQVEIDGEKFGGYQEQTVYEEPFNRDIKPVYNEYDGIYEAFNHTIKTNSLEDHITAFRGDLNKFTQEQSASFQVRLAFIDGDHSYNAVTKDIRLIDNMLVPGGWICFDDAFSYYDGVNQAITDHIINNKNYENCQQLTRKFFVAQKRVA